MSPTAVAAPAEEQSNPICEYHIARNIYEKPRVCTKCSTVICNKAIPVEKAPGWLTTYSCTLTVNHDSIHNNPLVKPHWRMDNYED
jgi:hypothetical protein